MCMYIYIYVHICIAGSRLRKRCKYTNMKLWLIAPPETRPIRYRFRYLRNERPPEERETDDRYPPSPPMFNVAAC